MHRAAAEERRPALRDAPEPLLAAAPVAAPAPVAAIADAAVDTAQGRWPEAMVARIEHLRDAAAAPGSLADTRIRLHPDALGHVEVALRREGDAVHVQLSVAEPAARTLLAEAQPRLAELAEQRGLKLGGSAVDSGGGNDRRQPPPPPQTRNPRPAHAPLRTTPDADTRLA